jgi:hypothetical protein
MMQETIEWEPCTKCGEPIYGMWDGKQLLDVNVEPERDGDRVCFRIHRCEGNNYGDVGRETTEQRGGNPPD